MYSVTANNALKYDSPAPSDVCLTYFIVKDVYYFLEIWYVVFSYFVKTML